MGKEKLLEAFETHDENFEQYKKQSKETIWEHSSINPKNVKFHEDLILDLYERK